jgi:hypothetical protein
MATKKVTVLEEELKNSDFMSILTYAVDSDSKCFSQNTLIDYSYPTGIPLIDYRLGYEVVTKDENGNITGKRLCLGLQAGTFNVLTGNTQTYKTTIGEMMIAHIAKDNSGNIIHLDPENRAVVQRIKNGTRLPDSWFTGKNPRYKIINGAIGFDTLQEIVTDIWTRKMKMRAVLSVDTGLKDDHGNPIMLMPPTCLFLDSVSDVINKEYDINNKKQVDELTELRSNTYGMTSAKTLRGVIADILPMLKEANILFLTIAHKNSNVSMNAFTPPKKQFQYGANDEKVSGGKALEYNASLVGNFVAELSADSRYHMDTDGFEGNTVVFEPIKCSTNESGNTKTGLGYRLVIDKRAGSVDNLRSLILYLNDLGRLKGNKAGFRVIDEKGEVISEKFTWKKAYEDFKADPVSYKTFMGVCKEELMKLVSKAVEAKESSLEDLYA